ncbi:hypothetical protein [Streptomyces zagrosensis]|uniref:Uncharacterized protein n=1 Tax=Streptomyces zagrosensis TaxID=1042984 RepID=A0A7W9QJB9_9ACTN|nr:hypothetical protein [Streptomyces zagrosensis]MBB5940332.1 hypothetical protein [Streptomyces zagrosensis]
MAVNTYLVLLFIIGALGVLAWFGAIWGVKTGRRWARPTWTMLCASGWVSR